MISRLNDDTIYKEEDIPVLTEAGIIFENKAPITSGRVVEAAKEAKRLWDAGNKKGFEAFVLGKCNDFTRDEVLILTSTMITKDSCIWDFIVDIEFDKAPTPPNSVKGCPWIKR
jgi:hypothetical protein